MTEYPPVTLITTIYFPSQERKSIAMQSWRSWSKYIKYAGDMHLHLSDDGSAVEWNNRDFTNEEWFRSPFRLTTQSRQERGGYGASLNAGLNEASKETSIFLFLVDDWALTQELDINPWVEALMTNESIGCIRLGPPHPGLTGTVEMISPNWQGWGLRLNKGGYAYGDRPAIYHERFFDAYNYFQEGVSALECVRLYDEKVARTEGPSIILALPHKFIHLDSPSLSSLEPGE